MLRIGDKVVELVPATEVRRYLGISRPTEIRMRKEGFLKGVKIGGQWFYHYKGLDTVYKRWRQAHPWGKKRSRSLF